MDVLNLIKERQSSRMPFDPNQPISKEDLQLILEAARWTPTAHNMQNFEIVVVDDKEVLAAIGNIKFPISIEFIWENYPLLSFSEEEWREKKVGIMGTMFPPAWLNPDVTEEDLAGESENEFLRTQIESTPILCVVTYDPTHRAPASDGDFLGIMSLGCMMENVWLMATALGIGVHIVSSLSTGAVGAEVKRLLGIPERLVIAFSFRLGYLSTTQTTLRVRRDVEDFTHHNQYGQKGLD